MIRAVFNRKDGRICGFSMSGHSGYGTQGNDVVCASVSSAAMLVCNTITDFFGDDADVSADEDLLELSLKNGSVKSSELLDSFYNHLKFISEDYPRSIKFSFKEM